MIKLIYYLIICSTLLLNNCKEPNTMPKGPEENNTKNGFNYSKANKKEDSDIKTALTADEEQKFNSLILGFNTIRTSIEDDFQSLNFTSSHIQVERTYTEFIPWLSNNPDKQKELANAFTTFYNFLDDKRQKYANNKTFEEYITDAINAGKDNHVNNKYGAKNENFIWNLFRDTIDSISHKDSKEEKFENIKIQLTSTDMINYYRTNWL